MTGGGCEVDKMNGESITSAEGIMVVRVAGFLKSGNGAGTVMPANLEIWQSLFGLIKRKAENTAYGQHMALSYMSDSGVPILYHESKSISWVLSIP